MSGIFSHYLSVTLHISEDWSPFISCPPHPYFCWDCVYVHTHVFMYMEIRGQLEVPFLLSHPPCSVSGPGTCWLGQLLPCESKGSACLHLSPARIADAGVELILVWKEALFHGGISLVQHLLHLTGVTQAL